MAGFLRGIVKEVPSGDTVVIVGATKGLAVAAEKRITLSSLVAPRLAKRDGTTKDEPFAWESREFLRKKLIGQPCVFKIDYVVEAIGNKEFGSVFLQPAGGQPENVAISVVAAGWAKVRATGTQQSPYYEDLKKAEEAAQSAAKGVWTKDPNALLHAVRPVATNEFNAMSFLQANGKGKPVAGIVEAVLNGSTLRLTLLPDLSAITISVCGVQCPSIGRKAAAPAAADGGAEAPAAPPPAANGSSNGAAAPPALTAAAAVGAGAGAGAGGPDPFAREAKFFSELRVLNREVRVILEGVDKYGNLFGSVLYPEEEKMSNLAEQLVTAGLAKCVEWSLGLMTTGSMKLREIERQGKAAKRGIWVNYVPVNTGQTKLSDTYVGKVVEVASGDTLLIKDVNAGVERRVQLSSVRAPRPGIRDRAPEPHGNEAREFMRKKLVGREVAVTMEYTRKVPANAGAPGPAGEERVLSFGNVELSGGPPDEPKNVAETVVARGYASVVRHRTDEERSSVYEELVKLEEAARAAKRGIHSNKEVAVSRINDVSVPGSAARAKQYLPFLQRAGRVPAVVEYVLSGHRLKVHVPREGVSIAIAPAGVRTPARPQPASNGRPAVVGEPYAEEAFAWTREHFMQRDVEIEVEGVDKGGTFLGTITLPGGKPLNLGLALLRLGLARLQPFFSADRTKGGAELEAAQAAAKNAHLKIWTDWTPEQDAPAEGEDGEVADAGASSSTAGAGEKLNVAVTEVAGAGEFYVQVADEPRVSWLSEQLAGLSLGDSAPPPAPLAMGSQCLAQFSLDKAWYRGYVEKVHPAEPKYEVYFVDYGNKERVDTKRVRPIDAALAAVPPQARPAALAHVKVPGPDSEWGPEAAQLLAELVGGGRKLTATVVGRERAGTGGPKERHPGRGQDKLLLVLRGEGIEHSVNAAMLAAGLARLPKLHKVRDPAGRAAFEALAAFEDTARKGHRGQFQYGDPGDSDDEEPAAPRPPPAKGGKR